MVLVHLCPAYVEHLKPAVKFTCIVYTVYYSDGGQQQTENACTVVSVPHRLPAPCTGRTVLARRGEGADAYPELLEAEWVGAHPRLSIAHLQTLGPQLAARPVASLLHDEDLFYKADRRTRSAHIRADMKCGVF